MPEPYLSHAPHQQVIAHVMILLLDSITNALLMASQSMSLTGSTCVWGGGGGGATWAGQDEVCISDLVPKY